MERINTREEFISLRKRLRESEKKTNKTITICMGTGCCAFNSMKVIEAIRKEIKEKKIGDEVGVRKTGCHGFCEKGPIVTILPEHIFYPQVNGSAVGRISGMHDIYPSFHSLINLFGHANHCLAGAVHHREYTVKDEYHTDNPRYDE